MNISDTHHFIQEKESELAQIRQAVLDATLQQEEEARCHLVHVLESIEIDKDRTRMESDCAIRLMEEETAASIERAKEEMIESIRHKEEEIFVAARLKMDADWKIREECFRDELNAILTSELELQRTDLISHYEAVIQGLNSTTKAESEKAAKNLIELNKEHQHQVEKITQIVWDDAWEKISADAETIIYQRLRIAEEQCEARDEQISALLDDRCSLNKLIDEKEALVAVMTNDWNEIACGTRALASDLNSQHADEMARAREDMADLLKVNNHLESEIDVLKSELSQSKLEFTAVETECAEHKLSVKALDNEKNRSESRIRELIALNQLVERELADATKEINVLTKNSEAASKKLDEIVRLNEMNENKVVILTARVSDLQTHNEGLERKHMLAVAQINNLEQEQREYKIVMDDRTKQSNKLFADALDSFKVRQGARPEPVVVHLHGSHGENSTMPNLSEKLSIECNNLRSKVLHLQRDNFRLKSELTIKGSGQMDEKDGKKRTSDSLLHEINSLKTIISAMRKEMERAAESNAYEVNEKSLMLSDSILEQQLIQCRSYLDLLLRPTEVANDGVGGDECAFIRTKYRELHRATDELREENIRLHVMCNASTANMDYDTSAGGEIDLIQKLDEAADEIEELLKENEKLTKLSNELRSELSKARHALSFDIESSTNPPTSADGECRAYEQVILDAILNDQSQSCESDGCRNDAQVACIGKKPPMASAANRRPSKTAYGSRPTTASERATTSQRQSFQRLLNRKKKEIALEKTKIRNWNVKDSSTNPYL